MGAQFSTNINVGWDLMDTETITVYRDVQTPNVFPVAFTKTVVYQGAADFQDNPTTLTYNPAGPIDSAEAVIVIDPDSSGNLPGIQPNDIVMIDGGLTYVVVESTIWNLSPTHLEVSVKRGPQDYTGA